MSKQLSRSMAEQVTAISNMCKALQLEVGTRHILLEVDSPNYAEVFNDINTLVESLRAQMRNNKYTCDTLMFEYVFDKNQGILKILDEVERDTILIISELLSFQNKWSTSYLPWLSSFKSQRTNREVVSRGEHDHVHLNYQVRFPMLDALNKDYIKLHEKLTQYISNLLVYSQSALALVKVKPRLIAFIKMLVKQGFLTKLTFWK